MPKSNTPTNTVRISVDDLTVGDIIPKLSFRPIALIIHRDEKRELHFEGIERPWTLTRTETVQIRERKPEPAPGPELRIITGGAGSGKSTEAARWRKERLELGQSVIILDEFQGRPNGWVEVHQALESMTSVAIVVDIDFPVSHFAASRMIEVILFKDSGKYYTTDYWAWPKDEEGRELRLISPHQAAKSPDARRIGNGAVLIPSQEPWGYPWLYTPGEGFGDLS